MGIALVLGLAAFLAFALGLTWQFRRLDRHFAQLSRQFERVQANAQAAMRLASQSASSANAAARQRNQADAAEAQSAQTARAAQQQAAAAQAAAVKAQQEAEQYRQEQEAELNRLQQALSQIAETRRTAMGLIMTLDSNSVRFAFNQATVQPHYRDILTRIATILMTLKGFRIFVYGYTDDIGTQAYNLKLSARRADAVRNYLVKAGIEPKIISAKGFGKTDPRVRGNTPQARAANRRVEIGIVATTINYQPVAAR